MQKTEINEIFRRWSAANPEPRTELNHINSFTLLVAVVLSAQSTDVGVNKATAALFKVADTPQKMVLLGEEKLKDYIKTIGLYNSKAANIIAASKMLIEEYDGEVPQTREKLMKLAGIGRKSANVILNVAFGMPTIGVDTHIFRVANRIGLTNARTPEKTELELEKVIPDKWKLHAHHWLVLHGRYICKARKPLCEQCIINDLCMSYDYIA